MTNYQEVHEKFFNVADDTNRVIYFDGAVPQLDLDTVAADLRYLGGLRSRLCTTNIESAGRILRSAIDDTATGAAGLLCTARSEVRLPSHSAISDRGDLEWIQPMYDATSLLLLSRKIATAALLPIELPPNHIGATLETAFPNRTARKTSRDLRKFRRLLDTAIRQPGEVGDQSWNALHNMSFLEGYTESAIAAVALSELGPKQVSVKLRPNRRSPATIETVRIFIEMLRDSREISRVFKPSQ